MPFSPGNNKVDQASCNSFSSTSSVTAADLTVVTMRAATL
jgi:hypothetical protein